MGCKCTVQVDIYAFGVVLVMLTTAQATLARGNLRLPTLEEAPKVCWRRAGAECSSLRTCGCANGRPG